MPSLLERENISYPQEVVRKPTKIARIKAIPKEEKMAKFYWYIAAILFTGCAVGAVGNNWQFAAFACAFAATCNLLCALRVRSR